MSKIKGIPYGIGAFDKVNANNEYYVDKTMYIPSIEETRNVFLIRPRRFGKSMFLSMLHTYYDLNKQDKFNELFHDTWILDNPTEEKSKYMILKFNFSGLDCRADKIEDSFNNYCNDIINDFVDKYEDYIDENLRNEIKLKQFTYEKIERLSGLKDDSKKIYVMIDEYDNFANTIISEQRISDYHKVMHASGMFKSFFAVLKKCSEESNSSIARMFITGVSPVTMDDVTSGCNIGDFVSTNLDLNEAFGFTLKDIHRILDYYIDAGKFRAEDKDKAIEVMKSYYDSYRFSEDAKETMFNTCSVLYFINKYFKNRKIPKNPIDKNLRTDYKKLKNLIVLNQKLNGNFNALNKIITNGGIAGDVMDSFSFEEIKQPENFISLLYHLGFLTFSGKTVRGKPFLIVPNETIRTMIYEYIRNSIKDVYAFNVNIYELSNLVSKMAYDGEIKEVFEFIGDIMKNQTSMRDYITKEKIVQGYYMAYLGINDYYIIKSEMELNKGYADITFIPFHQKYYDMEYAYICEFKYFPRIKDFDNLDEVKQNIKLTELRDPQISEAEKQLAKYVADNESQKLFHTGKYGDIKLVKHIAIFHGWELIYNEIYDK